MKKLTLMLLVLLIAGLGLTAYAAYDIGSFSDTTLAYGQSITFSVQRQKRYSAQNAAAYQSTKINKVTSPGDDSRIIPYIAVKVVSATNGTDATDPVTFVYGVDTTATKKLIYKSGYGLLNYYYKLNIENTTFTPYNGSRTVNLGGLWSPDFKFNGVLS